MYSIYGHIVFNGICTAGHGCVFLAGEYHSTSLQWLRREDMVRGWVFQKGFLQWHFAKSALNHNKLSLMGWDKLWVVVKRLFRVQRKNIDSSLNAARNTNNLNLILKYWKLLCKGGCSLQLLLLDDIVPASLCAASDRGGHGRGKRKTHADVLPTSFRKSVTAPTLCSAPRQTRTQREFANSPRSRGTVGHKMIPPVYWGLHKSCKITLCFWFTLSNFTFKDLPWLWPWRQHLRFLWPSVQGAGLWKAGKRQDSPRNYSIWHL